MAEGRNRRMWDHSATIAAAALSAFRDKMIDPAKLHPYEKGRSRSGKQSIPLTADNIEILKTVFCQKVDGPARKSGTGKKERAK